jgi:hypothetical protein
VQPGLSEEFIGGRGVGEGVGGVVGCEQVLDDGAGFPEGDVVVVWVGDGGDAAVGVDGFEGFWRVLLLGLASSLREVWFGGAGDCSLPWCRTLKSMSSVS